MATHSTRTKRPSKAAVARLRAQIESRPTESTLPADVAAVIANYTTPRVSPTALGRIRPFLVEAITASHLRGQETVRKHCNHLTQLGAYALKRGVPLEVTSVLTTALIDEYIRLEMAEDSDHNRAERRRRLLALARTANPGPDVPAKLAPIGHSSIKPCYSPDELSRILRAARAQPTAARQRDLAIVVALGAGAGLDSVDIRDLRVEHLEDLGEAGLRIRVQGPRPRVVILRRPFEDMLRDAVSGMRAGQLVLGNKQDRRNTAARAVERAALHNVPHIEIARLRATWLADVMTDSIPLAVILHAAGLKSARTIAELQPHLEPWLEHKGLAPSGGTALRGDAR